MKLDACGARRRCQVVGIVNEQVRSASAAVVVGHDTKVDLYAVPRGEAVAACFMRTDGEAESLVVLHRRTEVVDGKDRRYAFRGVSLAEDRLGIQRPPRPGHETTGPCDAAPFGPRGARMGALKSSEHD